MNASHDPIDDTSAREAFTRLVASRGMDTRTAPAVRGPDAASPDAASPDAASPDVKLAKGLMGRPRPRAALRNRPITNPDELRRVMKSRGLGAAAGGL